MVKELAESPIILSFGHVRKGHLNVSLMLDRIERIAEEYNVSFQQALDLLKLKKQESTN